MINLCFRVKSDWQTLFDRSASPLTGYTGSIDSNPTVAENLTSKTDVSMVTKKPVMETRQGPLPDFGVQKTLELFAPTYWK